MKEFTHLDEKGRARMVDVTEKDATLRQATARGSVCMSPEVFQKIMSGGIEKGDVLGVARIAGIMGAKRAAELIPLCHPLNITHVEITFHPSEENHCIDIEAQVRLQGKTGVEIEALTAVAIAALTIYDMCKAVDWEMVISDIRLIEKQGGKSGDFVRGKNLPRKDMSPTFFTKI
jgi:cyclic pyranopterin monophosphate synthase